MLEKSKIKFLVVHCSDTPDKSNLSAIDIHKMHLNFGWDGIGYHKIICRDGQIENGRPEFWKGAHVYGKNENSLGVCLIGKNKFTNKQLFSLKKILDIWKIKYPHAKILGHRDVTNTLKTCPNFDVKRWYEKLSKDEIRQIIHPSAQIRKQPNIYSELLSEALFGEIFEIKKIQENWIYGKLKTDDYYGWIKSSELGDVIQPTHKIITKSTSVFLKTNIKTAMFTLSIGSQVKVTKHFGDWKKIHLQNFCVQEGFIKSKDCVNSNNKIKNWKNIPSTFEGVPYFWGGRTFNGLDCSALVQLCLQTQMKNFPRDSKDQILLPGKNIEKLKNILKGDLIFWKGHVAFALSNKLIVHASAHHNKVIKETLDNAIKRIEPDYGKLLKILRFK